MWKLLRAPGVGRRAECLDLLPQEVGCRAPEVEGRAGLREPSMRTQQPPELGVVEAIGLTQASEPAT
jgi:hypothetical protein